MGCFLVSCGLTHQAIRPGEEVYIIPIARQAKWSAITYLDKAERQTYIGDPDFVYNTDLYKPLGIMLEGKYDDYGGYEIDFELIKNRALLHIYLGFLKEYSYKVLEGPNSVHDIPVDVSKLEISFELKNHNNVWDTLHEAVWQNRLLISNKISGIKAPTTVHYYIVSKKHADRLLNLWYNHEVSYPRDDLHNEFYKSDILGRYGIFLKQNKDIFENKYPSYSREIIDVFLNENHSSGSSAIISGREIREVIHQREEKGLKFDLFESFHNLQQFIFALNHMNKHPTPCYHIGQDYSNSSGTLYSIFMNDIYKDNIEEYLEENEEEIDSEEEAVSNILKSFGNY